MSLYKPKHEAFVRFCTAKAFGIMETEDLVNETIAAVYQNLERLRSEKAFLSYLFSTASNICKNEIRRKKIIFYQAEFEEHQLSIASESEDEKVDVFFLYKALNLLPPDQKEALVLFEISGFSIKEIAELKKTSEDCIKQRLSRGRKKLAELLLDRDISEEPIERRSHVLLNLFF